MKTRQTSIVGISEVMGIVAFLFFPPHSTYAQEGQHGAGHEEWHGTFYNKLKRPDTRGSCCNLADCRPTSIRTVGDHYEIMKDGRWIRLDPSKIVKDIAPDGGPHICAPDSASKSHQPDTVFCIVMPQEI